MNATVFDSDFFLMWEPIKIKWTFSSKKKKSGQTIIRESKLNRFVEVSCDLPLTAKISGDAEKLQIKCEK